MRTPRFRLWYVLALILICAAGLETGLKAQAKGGGAAKLAPGLYATFHTSKGTFVAELYAKEAPRAVANFVALAKGERAYSDPSTGGISMAPFYNGLLFFRTIPDFIIQTGDQLENGTGKIGYTIPFEKNNLKFNRPGRMALAQAPGDPSSRGAEIFFTVGTAAGLNKEGFLIIGQVVRGLAVVKAISEGPRRNGRRDTPRYPAILRSVTIETVK